MALTDIGAVLSRDIVSIRGRRFQRKYNFEVLLPMVGWVLGELAAPMIQAVSYSDYFMEKAADMKKGAYKAFYVDDLASPTLTFKFLETEEGIVRLYLNAWRNLMINRQGLWNNKSQYAKDIVLTYLTAEGLPIRVVKFRNAFPLIFYRADLSYESNEIQTIEVPFACDMVEEGIIGEDIVGDVVDNLLEMGRTALGNALSNPTTAILETPQDLASAGVSQSGALIASIVKSWEEGSIVDVARVEEALSLSGDIETGFNLVQSSLVNDFAADEIFDLAESARFAESLLNLSDVELEDAYLEASDRMTEPLSYQVLDLQPVEMPIVDGYNVNALEVGGFSIGSFF